MSAALINRSLTNVRTELEFLLDSEVIDQRLFDTLMESLPKKYSKDMAPWGVDKVPTISANGGKTNNFDNKLETAAVTDAFQKTSLHDAVSPPAHPPAAPVPQRMPASALGYCKASYNYESSESGDLKLAKGDLVAVLEHLSPDWWKGYKKGGDPSHAGVFPSNYVTVVSEAEFTAAASPEKRPVTVQEKASYQPVSSPVSAPPMYQQAPNSSNSVYQPQPYQQQQPQQQQPSYGGYAQFPPPSTGYYGQQNPPAQQFPQQAQQVAPQAVPQQQAGHGSDAFKRFGSKLGNAAIFGAGATIGGDIVNSIF